MRSSRGMTLLELLVGLMVLGMTGALLSGAMDLGARVWDRAGQETQLAVERHEAMRALRHLISQAEPVPGTETSGSGADAFAGAADNLRLLAYQPAWLAAGHGREIEVYQNEDAIELRIVDPGGDAETETLTLLDGIETLRLAYFDQPDPAQPGRWREVWDDRSSLPEIVRITVGFADRSAPMDIMVAPRKRYPLECLMNIRQCRGTSG